MSPQRNALTAKPALRRLLLAIANYAYTSWRQPSIFSRALQYMARANKFRRPSNEPADGERGAGNLPRI